MVLHYIQSVIAYFQQNPMHLLMVLFLVNKFVQSKKPFPECGGRVVGVHATKEFDDALAAATKKGDLLICDFFATWCPPCKTAAPIFGKLSEEWEGCDFVKVNVDECRELSQREAVQAMPTFKIYKEGKCANTVQGFNQRAIVEQLALLGARPAAAAGAAKSD